MSTDIFQDKSKSIPRSDPRIVRVEFDKSDLGARKSHTRGAHKKNDYSINHIKGG